MTNKTQNMALSFRFQHRSESSAKNDIRHDLRRGPQPKYIDGKRSHLNTVMIEPVSPSYLRDLCAERRELVKTERKVKINHSVASSFIITFGKGLQKHVDALPAEELDALFKAVADAVTDRVGIELTGLVAHRDETAKHAHGQCPARHPDGRAMGQVITRKIASEIQTIAMEAAKPFLPMIERGKPKAKRKADGEDPSAIYHRSVKQLHEDLPKEEAEMKGRITQLQTVIEAKEELVVEATARVIEMQKRVDKLHAKIDAGEEMTVAEEKRLKDYERRLNNRSSELQRFEGQLLDYREQVKTDISQERKDLAKEKADFLIEQNRFRKMAEKVVSIARLVFETLNLPVPHYISGDLEDVVDDLEEIKAKVIHQDPGDENGLRL